MRVLFIDGTTGHDPKERTSRPTGGILNSLTLIPEYLASKGHEVYVRSTFNKAEDINGVHYITEGQNISKWDVTVFNRDVLPKDFVVYCKEQGIKIVWWLHDIVQTSYLKDDAFTYVDKIVALSLYCKKTYSEFYSILEDKFVVIPNGVDSKLFYPGAYEKRDPNLYITASSLIKGFIPISTVFDNLKRVNPDVDFRIYSSQKLHGLENSQQQKTFLNYMEQHGAHVYHPVSPEVLAHLLRKAWCLLMPNSYPEICSNLLLQAQACGCPVVASNIGANDEFITHGVTGLKTSQYYPHDQYSWIVEYANLVMGLSNGDLHKAISDSAQCTTWDSIGRMWEHELLKLINN
jgi:glycosyltransferase involved in cell wall biosynthesis